MQFKEWLIDHELFTEKIEFKKIRKQMPGRNAMIQKFRQKIHFMASPREKLNYIRHSLFNYEDELEKINKQRFARHLDNCKRIEIWHQFLKEAYKAQIKFIVHLTGEGEPEDIQERKDIIMAARDWFRDHWNTEAEQCGLPSEQIERQNVEQAAIQELRQEKYGRAA